MKHALVTGGSGDIGAAICRQLAAAGLHVYVHANRHPDRAAQVVAEIDAAGGSACAVCFDVTNEARTRQVLEDLLTDGPVQVVVNNAGLHDDAIMAGMNEQQWRRVIEVCLNGFYHVTQPLLLPMMVTRWGRIINISSIAGVMGNRGQTNYAAAKAGLIGATRSLAREIASRGVTVNAVAPGIIAGQMSEGAFDTATIKQLVPMQRAGSSEEVAALVTFLASEVAGYISGQVIGINGAMI